jgi:hypothetical protein
MRELGRGAKAGRQVAAVIMALTAMAGAQESQRVYLSGRGYDDAVRWQFFCTDGRNSGQWTTIGVPSQWELRGFGTYNYGHDSNKGNEQGKYRRAFDVPADWAGRRIFIVFDGVMTDSEVWINGRSAGPKHQGGFYRFKYEITDLVTAGENTLDVTVSKVSSNRSVEQAERQADYWVFGGIFRPVYLQVVPQTFIDWVAIDARADGTFRLDAHLDSDAAGSVVRAEITGPDGAFLAEAGLGEVVAGRESVRLEAKVAGHKAWTAETPHLYTARASLIRDGRTIHVVTKRFGFRTFEVRVGEGLYLNGQKIRLRGINRHSFWPESGRCLNRQINYDDVTLIKEMNANAVRMSHYPPDEDFLDACDELGLYVLDELAGWQRPPYDTEVGKKLVKEMVTRDVCHPCILFWDNGNEGGWNADLDGEFALYDPQQRPVLHPWETFSGIDTDHYESYESTLARLAGPTLFMPTEFLHGLYDGGHGAGLSDYWEAMVASPFGAGGFLWVLADEGAVRTDKDGQLDVAGNLAPDGIVGPHREREGSFYTVREIWSPVQISPEQLPESFDGTLAIENQYDFTNLNECTFEIRLFRYDATTSETSSVTTLHREEMPGPDVAPHSRGVLDCRLPSIPSEAEVLSVTAIDPHGRDVWKWTWDLRGVEYYCDRYVQTEAADSSRPREVVEGDIVRVDAGRTTLRFARSGLLVGVSVAGEPVSFGSGPRLIGTECECTKFQVRREGDTVAIDAEYEGGMKRLCWTIYPTGWVHLDYEYELEGASSVFGVDFESPQDRMRRMVWLGRGPYRVWKNRTKGGQLGVWANPCKGHTPGRTWAYPEFKGYYRDWRWVVFETEQGRITMVNAADDLFLGVYKPSDGPDPMNTELDAPETGIALLHGIPPIGTKFLSADQLGPESQPNEALGAYHGAVWFHFDRDNEN